MPAPAAWTAAKRTAGPGPAPATSTATTGPAAKGSASASEERASEEKFDARSWAIVKPPRRTRAKTIPTARRGSRVDGSLRIVRARIWLSIQKASAARVWMQKTAKGRHEHGAWEA